MTDEDLDSEWIRQAPKTPGPARVASVIDLFAGCGGMSLGVHRALAENGIATTGLAVEADPAIAAVYAANFPEVAIVAAQVQDLFDGTCGDEATEVEHLIRTHADPVHILMGGPPCQGHSDLNNRTRRSDPRNKLYLRMARAAEVLRPRVVVIENVPAVIHDASSVVQDTIKVLEKSEYSVGHRVLSLVNVGVPQTRRRHVLLAIQGDSDPAEILSSLIADETKTRNVRWAIEDLLDIEDGPLDRPARRSKENAKRMKYLFDKDKYDLPNDLRPRCHRDKKHTYTAVYGRLDWDKPAPTITTGFTSMGQGRYVHPAVPRTLTPHEAARLQTFPDWFKWETERRTVLSTAIGNAVPPILTHRLTLALLPHLFDHEAEHG